MVNKRLFIQKRGSNQKRGWKWATNQPSNSNVKKSKERLENTPQLPLRLFNLMFSHNGHPSHPRVIAHNVKDDAVNGQKHLEDDAVKGQKHLEDDAVNSKEHLIEADMFKMMPIPRIG